MNVVRTLVFLAACALALPAAAADACKNRGDLDLMYCDENKDLVADTPKDPRRSVQESEHHRLHLYARRRSGGLRESLLAFHRVSGGKCLVKESGVLPGAIECGRN